MSIKFRAVLFLASFLFPFFAQATPAQIVIIRHGEKADDGPHVSQQGCVRAYRLPQFFKSNATVNQFGTPVAIFAMAAHEKHDSETSVRALETMAPTAQLMGLKILDPAGRLDYATIVNDIIGNSAYNGKTVLIAWEHKATIGLTEAFGVTVQHLVKKWPSQVYDEAWVLNMKDKSLQIIPEKVLPNDNPVGGIPDWENGPTGSLGQDFFAKYPQCNDSSQLDKAVAGLTQPPYDPAVDWDADK